MFRLSSIIINLADLSRTEWGRLSVSIFILAIPVISFLFPPGLTAQQREGVPDALYLPPGRIMDGQVIENARNALLEGGDLDSLESDLKEQLSIYQGQYLDGKRTYYERRISPMLQLDSSAQSIRKFVENRDRLPGARAFMGDDPYLFWTHKALGRIYENRDETDAALNHYREAIRYTHLELPYRESQTVTESEKLLRMILSYSDPSRLSQELDTDVIAQADEVSKIAVGYGSLLDSLDEAKKQIYVEESKAARGQPADIAGARSILDTLSSEKKSADSRINEIFNNSYRPYLDRKRADVADTMYRIARILRKKEQDLKDSLRLEAGDSFYRGKGDATGIPVSNPGDNTGYENWLESARRMMPENALYNQLLAEHYERSGKYEYAIDRLKDFIEISKKTSGSKEDIAEAHFTLGGLYIQLKDYITGAEHYETYISMVQPENARLLSLLYLADIHFQHTGKINRADELYMGWLDRQKSGMSGETIEEKSGKIENAYRVKKNLSIIAKRNQRTSREKKFLALCLEDFNSLRGMQNQQNDALLALEKRINELKRVLLHGEKDEEQRDYFRLLRIEKPEVERVLGILEKSRRTMDIATLLERMAYLAQRDRDFSQAIIYYRKILDEGRSDQITRARKNIDLINQTLVDGYLRNPILPPNFER